MEMEFEAMGLISAMYAYIHCTNVDVRVLKMEAMESKQNVCNEKPLLFQRKKYLIPRNRELFSLINFKCI